MVPQIFDDVGEDGEEERANVQGEEGIQGVNGGARYSPAPNFGKSAEEMARKPIWSSSTKKGMRMLSSTLGRIVKMTMPQKNNHLIRNLTFWTDELGKH
jgi:hypothetical protein